MVCTRTVHCVDCTYRYTFFARIYCLIPVCDGCFQTAVSHEKEHHSQLPANGCPSTKCWVSTSNGSVVRELTDPQTYGTACIPLTTDTGGNEFSLPGLDLNLCDTYLFCPNYLFMVSNWFVLVFSFVGLQVFLM